MQGILSIQSAVAYGHVGNSAAVFPLQRMGFEVWPVNTVQFSNHTGYGAWRGHMNTVEQIEAILEGVAERGAFPRCAAVLSGYLGDPSLGAAVLGAVAKVRAANRGALYACDPVIGDEGRGMFVKPGIPEFFRDQALPAADIVTPNAFELGHLTGEAVTSVEHALAASAKLRAAGPHIVVTTSLIIAGETADLVVLADTGAGSWLVRTPNLTVDLNGTGDAFSALFLGHYLRTGNVPIALSFATSAMYALVELTQDEASRELLLVKAQANFAEPARLFAAEKVR